MKKVLTSILSIFAFWFLFSIKVDAVDYNGELGYSYSSSSTTFWFVSDEDIESIDLYVDTLVEPLRLENYSKDVYYYNYGGDLVNKEYYYRVCYVEKECKDVIDPFAKTLNIDGTKNVILDTQSYSVSGWENVNKITTDSYNTAIYAIEADKYVEQLSVVEEEGVEVNNSIFSKLVSNTKYNTAQDNSTLITGYNYLQQAEVKYLEIGDLYDSSNYFSPNWNYASKIDNYSAIKELKQLMIGYKNINMNVIARMDILTPCEELKNNLLSYSSNYITNDGKINLDDPMMQRYIKDVYKYWVSEYRIDGFYILNASLYGQEYLKTLIEELKAIKSNLLIYTDSSQHSTYYTSDNMQEILFGSLFDANANGIINGDFSETNFDNLVNAMFGGYYSDKSKYDQAGYVINNIGSFSGLDLYSKVRLVAGLSASESKVIDKIKIALYTIISSTGIPRIIAGNEFFNTTAISTNEVDSTPDNQKVCINNTKWCYARGDSKVIDWGYLQKNSSILSRLLSYRQWYIYQYPSLASMKYSENITYHKDASQLGILYLEINYDADSVGDIERSVLLINYSEDQKEIDSISSKDYQNVSSIIGKLEKNDDKTKIYGLTIFTFTETKVSKIPNWAYMLIAVALLIVIFGGRALLIRLLKNKTGVDYNEYKNQKKDDRKSKKKKKKVKEKGPSIFETYLSDVPLFSKFKKKKAGEQKGIENKQEDNEIVQNDDQEVKENKKEESD